jgi:hypothetical protein
MRGNKYRFFRAYTYYLFLDAIMVPFSRTVCSPGAAVYLIPLTHGIELLVLPQPPLSVG